MKKIIKRVCIGLLIFIVVVVSAVCVFLFSGGEKPVAFIPTVTDAGGKAYGVVEGDNGETMIVVTDQNGDRYAAHTNADGTPGETVTQINDKVDIDQLPQNQTGPVIDVTVSGSDFAGTVVSNSQNSATTQYAPQTGVQTSPQTPTTQPGNQVNPTAATQSPSAPGGQTTAPSEQSGTTYKIEKYQQLFMSNTYLMEFTTDSSEFGDTPVTFATKNGNFVMTTSMDGYSMKILYIKSKQSTYLLMDNFKKYSKIPQDMLGEDINMDDVNMMSGIGDSKIEDKDIEVSQVTINGQQLTCESYKAKDGTTMKYYFSGDTLVRIDAEGKQSTSYIITRITSDVPDSTFEIPKDYSYFNLAWLSKLDGLSGSSKASGSGN